MKLTMKKQKKVGTTAKKKEKRNRKLNQYILELEAENKSLRNQFDNPNIEQILEVVHKAYCEQYKKKNGNEYWTEGDFSRLDDEIKEYDRATVRAVLQALKG